MAAVSAPLLRRPLTPTPVNAYDLSDLQPPAFAATAGQGRWDMFQRYLSGAPEHRADDAPSEAGVRPGAPLRTRQRGNLLTAPTQLISRSFASPPDCLRRDKPNEDEWRAVLRRPTDSCLLASAAPG